MDELKPCPFCGQKAERSPINGSVCCPVRGIGKHTDYLRPDVWQTRPIEDALQQRVEELEMNVSALRSLNKRLVEDGERLAKELEGAIFVIDEFPIDYSNGITWNGIDEGRVKGAEMEHKMREDGHKAIDQHTALMKELEEK